jgi:hypothetical protein
MKKIILTLTIALFNFCLANADTIEIQGGETMFDAPYTNSSFVELLLQHSSGKRAGYDKRSDSVLSELQKTCYAEQGMGEKSKTKTLVYEEPLSGKYALYVTAKESGIYLVQVDILMGEKYESKLIAGLEASGDKQTIEINYAPNSKTSSEINKKVDVALLKREMELALRMGHLEKGIGKEMVEDLMHIDKSLNNYDYAEARYTLRLVVSKLANRLEAFRLNSRKDINSWFTSYFTANPNDMQEIIAKQDHFFLNIGNINDNKKGDWLEARSVSILLADTKSFLDSIKITSNSSK